MAYTENLGLEGAFSNSQSTYTTPNFLRAGDIIESNKTMFSALTKVLQKTHNFQGTRLHKHSKCQMKQVNKLTEAVTQLPSSCNTNKLAVRRTGEDDGENDRGNRVTIHEMDCSIHNETNLAASFLSGDFIIFSGNNR